MRRLAIVGFGDIARRAAPALARAFELLPLARHQGFDLDHPETLALAPMDVLVHCVAPAGVANEDARTSNLLRALEGRDLAPRRVVYVSTSGVYGDCVGALVDETRAPAPQTSRARRRLDAEQRLASWCAQRGAALVILRAPGIYAADRLPLEHLRRGLPVLRGADDVYTSHIHADDLAGALVRACDETPAGLYNVADDSVIKMGDWLELVAERSGLDRPRRLPRSALAELVPSDIYSFMCESRLLDNRRMKEQLGVALRHATVYEGLGLGHAISADQPA